MHLENAVIAAIKSNNQLKAACNSSAALIFDLAPSISSVKQRTEYCKSFGKPLFIHLDLVEGIGKDKAGLEFIKQCGVDGIISTRAAIIKTANELGLKTVQRIFIIDSQSIKSATAILKINPDMLEIMPGVVPRAIKEFKNVLPVTIIAGGLIESERDIKNAFDAGASAVSTSMENLWNYR